MIGAVAVPSSAEEQIRRAVARYAHGVDRLDVEVMKSAYWPDATDDHGVYVGGSSRRTPATTRPCTASSTT